MTVTRFGSEARAEDIRALAPPLAEVEDDVRAIVDQVRAGGDAALLELIARLDGAQVAAEELRVSAAELEGALAALEAGVVEASAWRSPTSARWRRRSCASRSRVSLPQGQQVEIAELPVRRAGGVRAGRPGPVSVDGRDVRGDRGARPGWTSWRCARRRGRPAARTRPSSPPARSAA